VWPEKKETAESFQENLIKNLVGKLSKWFTCWLHFKSTRQAISGEDKSYKSQVKMSQHFTSIFENLRFVTIKRSTNAQQQQQQQQQLQQQQLQQQQLQQQQQQLQQQQKATCVAQQQNSRKIKAQTVPTVNGNGLLSGNPEGGGDSSPSHEVDHPGGAAAAGVGGLPPGAGAATSSSGTPLRHPKRASISTASPPIRERRGTNTSIVVELDASGSGSGSGQGAGGPASGSGTASGKSSRELSPSPKNQQQPRKMSQDYRSRAGR